jgi:hypothetical protein
MSTFEFILFVVLITLSGYNSWITTNLSMKGVNMALSPETQAQLDRIDAATTKIGDGVTTVAQRLVDLAGQIGSGTPPDQTDLVTALTNEADKLSKIGDDLTAIASPSDPNAPVA